MEALARRNALTVVLMVVIVIMGIEMAVLARQNRRLQSILAEAPSLQIMRQGQTVPPLTAPNLDGAAVAVRYGDHQPSTLLIWFSPSCHLCAENAAFWNETYDRYKNAPGIRFLVMSDADANETRAYVAEHALRLPVVCATDQSLVEAYNGRVVPQMALISPQGGIEQVWPGPLEKARQDEITAVLDSLATQSKPL